MRDIFEKGKYLRTECDACGKCCTTIIFRKGWFEEHKNQVLKPIDLFESENIVIPFTEDGKCCFQLPDGKCSIQDEKDEVCTSYWCEQDQNWDSVKLMRSWKTFMHKAIQGRSYELVYELRELEDK